MNTQHPTLPFCTRAITVLGLALMTAATVRADYPSTVLGDNPLAYYAINPGTDPANTSPDLTGNGNNGAAFNLTPVPGPTPFITNASSFDGSVSAVDLSGGSNPGLLNFAGPITMEAWAQPSNTTEGPANIIAKGYDSALNNEITLRANAGNYFGGSYDGSSHGASGGQQTTNWAYLVCTYDGINWNMYVNATLVQSNPDATGALNFSDPWRIGTGSGDVGTGRYFTGNISQVALYNHGLTPAQVLNHFYIGEINASPSNSAPIITVQPQSQSTFVGGTVTFSVGDVSAFPTTNQWFKNSTALTGKTNATLTITNVSAADATNYSVVVGNGKGATNSVTASLILLTSGNSLKWSASGNSGVWDTGSSPNWINVSNSQQVVFNANDQVLFDDSVGAPTNVTVSGTVSPSVVTVNSSANNYTFGGSGSIGGAGSLVKQGSSTLTIVSPANFTGPVTISGGTIYAGDFSFTSVSSVTITNNSTLDFGGSHYDSSALSIIASGTGVSNQGALFNSIFAPSEVLNIALAGDTTFGGSSRWDWTGGTMSGPHKVTVNWSNSGGYGEWNSTAIAANVGDIELATGKLGIKSMGANFGNPTGNFIVDSGTELDFWTGDAGYAKNFHVLSGGLFQILTSFTSFNGNLTLENGAKFVGIFGGGNQSLNGTFTLNGVADFQLGDGNFIFSNVISGPGGFVRDAYNHLMVFQASNTYSGPTIIGDGLTVALSGNGSISHSSLIFFGGSTPTNVLLDVSTRTDGALTLANGQTLGGIGTINGSLTVGAGATISPAGTNTTIGITAGANATGTIAATGTVVLDGTTTLKLNGSGVNDEVQAGAGITYGGTLNLVNISGAPYAIGNSFQIFSAASYTNSFANITPATPGTGLAWDKSQLNIGFLNVVAAPLQPVLGGTRVSGGNLVFSGTGGAANGTYSVLTATNLTTPVTNWTVLLSSNFDGTGAFSVSNAITPGVPQKFYLLRTP